MNFEITDYELGGTKQVSHQHSLKSCPVHGATPLRSSTTHASAVLVTYAIASALK